MTSENEHKNENEKTDKKNINFKKELKKFSKNYWAISTAILALLLIGTFFLPGNPSGMVISAEEAGEKLLDFANNQGANAELVNTTDDGTIYTIVLSIEGQEFPLYVTRDGKKFTQQLTPLETQEAPTRPTAPAPEEIPKSDKPEVELYVWAYCPYGVQAQGPLAEVAELLGDSADLKIVPYHDGHGPYETQQNQIQSCIQKLDATNYWAYASKFVTDIYPKCGASRDIQCNEDESVKLMKSLGIDSDAVMSCVETEGDALFTAAKTQAQSNGVTGSPTLTINGVKANVARDAESYKTAICDAFNTAPEACSETLAASAAGTAPAAGNC